MCAGVGSVVVGYRCCCRSMMAPPFFSPAQRRDERPIEIVEIHRGSFKLLFSLDSGVIILFAIPRKIFGSGGNGIGASALEGVVDSRHTKAIFVMFPPAPSDSFRTPSTESRLSSTHAVNKFVTFKISVPKECSPDHSLPAPWLQRSQGQADRPRRDGGAFGLAFSRFFIASWMIP